MWFMYQDLLKAIQATQGLGLGVCQQLEQQQQALRFPHMPKPTQSFGYREVIMPALNSHLFIDSR
jgi:hypothetical protein